MLDVKICNCNTNVSFSKGHYMDMNMEIYSESLTKNKLVKIHEYIINGQTKKLFTYLAENVR